MDGHARARGAHLAAPVRTGPDALGVQVLFFVLESFLLSCGQHPAVALDRLVGWKSLPPLPSSDGGASRPNGDEQPSGLGVLRCTGICDTAMGACRSFAKDGRAPSR